MNELVYLLFLSSFFSRPWLLCIYNQSQYFLIIGIFGRPPFRCDEVVLIFQGHGPYLVWCEVLVFLPLSPPDIHKVTEEWAWKWGLEVECFTHNLWVSPDGNGYMIHLIWNQKVFLGYILIELRHLHGIKFFFNYRIQKCVWEHHFYDKKEYCRLFVLRVIGIWFVEVPQIEHYFYVQWVSHPQDQHLESEKLLGNNFLICSIIWWFFIVCYMVAPQVWPWLISPQVFTVRVNKIFSNGRIGRNLILEFNSHMVIVSIIDYLDWWF